MTVPAKVSAAVIALLLWTTSAFADSDASVCPELSGYFTNRQTSKLPDPSREPTQTERAFIDKSKIQLLERTDYAMGVSMVDADNDGKEDLFVWNVQGSGRFVSAELFDIPSKQLAQARELAPKASMDLGILDEPRFVRFKGVNYIASTDTGDSDGARITRIAKGRGGSYEMHTVCQMQTTVKPDRTCRHPACRKLQEMVETKTVNAPFVNVEWPHKYFAPAGLEVFFCQRVERWRL